MGNNGAASGSRILITGGAGYVGCALTAKLLELGHTVVVFDNLMSGGRGILPFFAHPNFEFVKGIPRGCIRGDLSPAKLLGR